MVCTALTVWNVVSTNVPSSVAVIAARIVASSRMLPIKMISGLCCVTYFSAIGYECTSRPSSRWLIMLFLSVKRNSIGSSIVITCFAAMLLMYSIIVAIVVDLPLPAGPDVRNRPLGSSQNIFKTSIGRLSSSNDLTVVWTCRATIAGLPRCVKILMRKRPMPSSSWIKSMSRLSRNFLRRFSLPKRRFVIAVISSVLSGSLPIVSTFPLMRARGNALVLK